MIAIGLPAFNEEKNIAKIIVKLQKFADKIIVCNDGSTDFTGEIAEKMGFKEVKNPPFNSHGKAVFKKGNQYISADRDMHNGGTWKSFDEKGNRLGTYNEDLTIFMGK